MLIKQRNTLCAEVIFFLLPSILLTCPSSFQFTRRPDLRGFGLTGSGLATFYSTVYLACACAPRHDWSLSVCFVQWHHNYIYWLNISTTKILGAIDAYADSVQGHLLSGLESRLVKTVTSVSLFVQATSHCTQCPSLDSKPLRKRAWYTLFAHAWN